MQVCCKEEEYATWRLGRASLQWNAGKVQNLVERLSFTPVFEEKRKFESLIQTNAQWCDCITLLQDNYGQNMGLSSPHNILWKTVQLPFDRALEVVQHVSSNIREQKLREMTDVDDDTASNTATRPSRQRLKVAMDANLVGYKHLRRTSISPTPQSIRH